MLFNKKNKSDRKCELCGSFTDKKNNFCPNCGNSFLNPKEEREKFGLLGRDDYSDGELENENNGFGFTDKLINSVFNSVIKSLDKQFQRQMRELDGDTGNPEVRSFPNGVRIKISGPFSRKPKKTAYKLATRSIDEDRIKKMSSLPKTKAKTTVKRIGDKVIYELSTRGVESAHDVFVSKLESGYEIKAIGDKKVYVNSIPVNLPLARYSILKNKLLIEFNTGDL